MKNSCILAGAISAAIWTAPAASAQGISLPDRFSYAAKFVCGTSLVPTTSPPQEPVVKRGNYATAVNIHNPWSTTVSVTKQISLGVAERYPETQFVSPTKRVFDKVPSGSTMYVDCAEIVNLLHGIPIPGPFIEGYVVIDSYLPGTPTVPDTAAEVDVV